MFFLMNLRGSTFESWKQVFVFCTILALQMGSEFFYLSTYVKYCIFVAWYDIGTFQCSHAATCHKPTPPKFNSSPLKNHGWKMNLLLGFPILRGYVKFPGRNHPLFFSLEFYWSNVPVNCEPLGFGSMWRTRQSGSGMHQIMGASGKMKPEQAHKKRWVGMASRNKFPKKKENTTLGMWFRISWIHVFFFDVVKLTCFQMHSQGGKFHSREMLNYEGEDDRILMVQESGSKPGMYAKTLLKRCKCQYIIHTWQVFVTIFGFG